MKMTLLALALLSFPLALARADTNAVGAASSIPALTVKRISARASKVFFIVFLSRKKTRTAESACQTGVSPPAGREKHGCYRRKSSAA